MTRGNVIPLRPADQETTARIERATKALQIHLGRSKLAARTATAYQRQAGAYTAWVREHLNRHPDAFTDRVGAEGAVTAWRRHLIAGKAAPSSINQALAAVTLLYEVTGIAIQVERARVPAPGEPPALTRAQQGAVERAAARRGPRDAAIIAVLLYTGARVEECARLDLDDVPFTARTGEIRLWGKGDHVRKVPLPPDARRALSALLETRGREPGPLWTGQRGRLTVSGITQVVLTVGAAAGIPGLRPHQLRHTYATRLRQGGADPALIKEFMGHASLDTTARYFRPGAAERAALVAKIFEETDDA